MTNEVITVATEAVQNSEAIGWPAAIMWSCIAFSVAYVLGKLF
jgi:hypothetical protein